MPAARGPGLSDFKALTLDCYGTLIDWEPGILAVLRDWARRRGVEAGDEELLASFARAEARCERESPQLLYPDILRSAHGLIARGFGEPPDPRAADALAASVGAWPPFEDTVPALRALGRRYRLVVVSNVDRSSFAATQRRLDTRFDAVVTAEEVGAYKPDLRMFRRALEVLRGMGVEPGGVLHVAQSLYHDHLPAKQLGLPTVQVDRRRGRAGAGATPDPASAVTPDWTVGSLAELASLVERERGLSPP